MIFSEYFGVEMATGKFSVALALITIFSVHVQLVLFNFLAVL